MLKAFLYLLYICWWCGSTVMPSLITKMTRLPRSSTVSFTDPIPTRLWQDFQLKGYDISLYLYQRWEAGACSKDLIYKVQGVPTRQDPVITEPLLNIDGNKRLIVLIHGFNTDSNQEFPKDTAKLLCSDDLEARNVIVVDWGKLAFAGGINQIINIDKAVNYASFVAGYVAKFMVKLFYKGQLNPQNTHLIGHSLGSYVAAYVARGYKNRTKTKIERMTVLDPPFILRIDEVLNFNLSDAEYMDSILTSSVTTEKRVGHVDFRVNPESWTQPNCGLSALLPFPIGSRRRSSGVSCSHSLAHVLFKESITNRFTPFTAKKCPQYKADFNDWSKCLCPIEFVYMGYYRNVDLNLEVVSGVYLVETNAQAPFVKNICPLWGNED